MTSIPDKILVICTRRNGDVLLATPLVHTLRKAFPHARIDMLVFASTRGIISRNTDIDQILTIQERPSFFSHLAFLWRIWRKYDWAISTQSGDRPVLYAFAAGRLRIGMIDEKHRFKSHLLHMAVSFDDETTHTVRMNLALAQKLNLPADGTVMAGFNDQDAVIFNTFDNFDPGKPYVVLHMVPQFTYKAWHMEGWVTLADWLIGMGFQVVFTGSDRAMECAMIESVIARLPPKTLNLAGILNFGQVAYLVSRSRLYVGTDTVVTHLAAATGVPTLALFGPTNPVKWAPWPKGWSVSSNPFERIGTQWRGNVYLLQGEGSCVPCHLEGCQRREDSDSDCLKEMSPQRVIRTVRRILEESRS
ncbi:MAG TPA: glycosyltransferase family 9 protein [Burkholderiales bacterium]|nr:glycosyltransferase family 9 protein [Burkholderiales bacterium]